MSSDKYAWLENLEDPKVIGWASKQDSISRRSLKASSERLYRRLVRLFDETVVELALVTKEGLVLWMSDSRTNTVELRKDDGGKKTLLNSKQLGDNATVIRVYARPEGGVVAVTYSLGGSDEGTTAFIDTRTSKILDRIEGVIWGIVWLNEKSFYYVRMHAKEKSEDGVDPPTARVYLRSAGKDKLVFGQGLGTDYFVDVRPSSDGNKALLDVSFGWTRSRPYAGDLKHPEAWSPIYPDRDAVVTLVDHSAGRYLLLSFEKSRGQVLSTDGQIVRRVIDEAEWPLDSVSLVGDKLLCHYLVDACSELRLFDQTGRRELTLKFDAPGSISTEPRVSTFGGEAVFVFSSFVIPYRVYRLREGRLDTVMSRDLPGKYSVRHDWAESRDGTLVHYFLVSKRMAPTNKVMLYGYGGFRLSLTPSYRPSLIPLLEDGGTFAFTNLRGGLEKGEDWHRAGMREKKPSVFEDFIAVAERLKAQGSRLVAVGRSNGGLLVGACLNLRPDLFSGAIIGYPVLDMLSFHRLYIGRAWVPEYGDPEVPEDAEFLAKYSPYHNIKPRGKYPPVFIYTGLKDDRVHPSHAFKYYARMKDAGATALMRVEMESGHEGSDPRSLIKENSAILAFAYRVLGL